MIFYMLILFILVSIIIYLVLRYSEYCFKQKFAASSWDTLEHAHPEFAILLHKHENDPVLFDHIDTLLDVKTISEFNTQIKNMIQEYPDFKTHLESISSSNNDLWSRFLAHRSLAKSVFYSLKPV